MGIKTWERFDWWEGRVNKWWHDPQASDLSFQNISKCTCFQVKRLLCGYSSISDELSDSKGLDGMVDSSLIHNHLGLLFLSPYCYTCSAGSACSTCFLLLHNRCISFRLKHSHPMSGPLQSSSYQPSTTSKRLEIPTAFSIPLVNVIKSFRISTFHVT